MREGTVDDIRIRSEGGLERLEELTARFRRATTSWERGEPDDVPSLSTEDDEAVKVVTRLDANHESLKALREAREAFEAVAKEWVKNFGPVPAHAELPIRFSALRVMTYVPSSERARAVAVALLVAFVALGGIVHHAITALSIVPVLFLLFSQRERLAFKPVLVTAGELRVGERRIPLGDLLSVEKESATHVIVKHRGGTVTLTPTAEQEQLFETLRAAIQ